jgi:hypothetical protein
VGDEVGGFSEGVAVVKSSRVRGQWTESIVEFFLVALWLDGWLGGTEV